jgi:hypothetical protein
MPIAFAPITSAKAGHYFARRDVMVARTLKLLAAPLLLAALPMAFAFAADGGRSGGTLGGGVGAAGAGSAAVGGGAPAGRVGGGPAAGAVGGGLPGAGDPAGNGAAGTGNPTLNALGAGSSGNRTNAPGIPSSRTQGGAFGGPAALGATTAPVAPARALPGGAAPAASSAASSSGTENKEAPSRESKAQPPITGGAEGAPFSPTGFSRPGRDGVSTVIVAARRCSVAAHETDGFTTCVGVPGKRRR